MRRLHFVGPLLALIFAAAQVPDAAAQVPAHDEIRVINNHGALVNVYAEDEAGHRHKLGRVGMGGVGTFDVPEGVDRVGLRIKVYAAHPIWSWYQDDFGVKTRPIDFRPDTRVTFWLEPDLTKSLVEVASD